MKENSGLSPTRPDAQAVPALRRSPIVDLTQDFYAWEKRGRGWQTWGYAVPLEPPFRPFIFHGVSARQIADDGRSPTLLSGLKDFAAGLFKKRVTPQIEIQEPTEEPTPWPFELGISEAIQVSLPSKSRPSCHRSLTAVARSAVPPGIICRIKPQTLGIIYYCRSGHRIMNESIAISQFI